MIPMLLDEVAAAVGAEVPPGAEQVQVRRVVTDSRRVEEGDLFVAISGPRFDGLAFIEEAAAGGAVACMCSAGGGPIEVPGRAVPRLVVADPVEALGRLASFYRRDVLPPSTVLVGITGSNGKTTTKRMIHHVLSASLKGRCAPRSFNNHLGVPLTLLSADADDRYLIVEIGTNSPGEVAALAAMVRPHVGVITSIGEAHLEGLGDLDAVAVEKTSLLKHVWDHGFAVVNIDRREIKPHLPTSFNGRLMTIGLAPEARLRITDVQGGIDRTEFVLDGRFKVTLPMPGVHHAANAAVALAVGRWFGLDPEDIAARLRSFVPPEGRTRTLKIDRMTVVDDTYNANPASMAAAITTLANVPPGKRVFVMGDMLELGPGSAEFHRQVVQAIGDAGIETLIALGPESTAAASALQGALPKTQVLLCEDQDRAVEALRGLLHEDYIVWVKGSRGMELDRLVHSLQRQVPKTAAVA